MFVSTDVCLLPLKVLRAGPQVTFGLLGPAPLGLSADALR
jgi:hypothetical protein